MTVLIMPSEQRRRRRRRLLIWGGLPLWLTALVLGLHLALLNAVAATAAGQYDRGEVGAANVGYTYLKSTNVVERWKAPYNLGTSLTRGGEAWLGYFYLTDALELAPEDAEIQCTILINLAIATETMADDELAGAQEWLEWADEAQGYVDAGEPYPPYSPWGDLTPDEIRAEARAYAAWAAAYYQAALDARAACAPEGQSTEEQQQNQDSQDRLEDKQQDAQSQANEPDEPSEGGGTADEEEQRRQEELNQRNAEAAAEADAERQEQGGGGGGETRNW